MEYDVRITDMQAGSEIEGFYLLADPAQKTSAKGKPFLAAKLTDRTGSIDLKVWDYTSPFTSEDAGSVVKVRGRVTEYRGALQFTADQIRPAAERDVYDLGELVPVAPIDRDSALEDIRAILSTLSDPSLRALCERLLEEHIDAFGRIPAGKSVHHSFVSGLLMHTHTMLRAADLLAGLYGDVVDRDLLLTGTLLHDFGKEYEFDVSPLGLVKEYSPEGQLLGHLYMGAQMVAKACEELAVDPETTLLLQHMLLSHHGAPEFGAAVVPKTAEAELLSYIDLIDSRMEIYREQLAELRPGQFSGNIFALGKKIYKHG